MTDKQKQAIKILNHLWNANGGLMVLKEEEYFTLLECVLDNNKHHNDYPTDKQWEDYFKNRDKTPLAQCVLPDGVCTNPFHDCIGCPRQFDSGNYITTTNKVEEQQ